MRLRALCSLFIGSIALFAAAPLIAAPVVYVSRPGEIVRLADLNDDGDFLDAVERITYCDGLPSALGAIVATNDALFVTRIDQPVVYRIADLNADGDALDAGEVVIHAEWSIPPLPMFTAMAALPSGEMLIADATGGLLYRAHDLNGDGDALDFGELKVVAENLSSPVAMAVRPDGCVLVAQNQSAVPVRILCDRNGDGDFLDFAENLSYAENFSPGSGLCASGNHTCFLPRPVAGEIVQLRDLNGDGDALDVGEIVTHAMGVPSATRIAADASGDLYVAAADGAGTVYRVRDANSDGDAMDMGEVTAVANGLISPAGVAIPPARMTPSCIRGDMNADGAVSIADVSLVVSTLIDPTGAEFCRADANDDGVIDGRDIVAFVEILLR